MRNSEQRSALDRRRFLCSAATISSFFVSGALRSESATAMDPIQRSGSKFKFSLAAYSYRRQLKSGELTLADFVDDCARFGLEGTELTSYYFPQPVSDEYLLELKRHCFGLGLDVSGTAVGNDFGHPPGEKRDAEIASVKRWVDHAAVLGAPVIRIFAGHVPDGGSPELAQRHMIDGIMECCEYAGHRGVYLALENHGGPTATADGLLSIVREIRSPWFGVNLDTGNFRSRDVYDDLRKAAPFAVNVQVKVKVRQPNGDAVAADFEKIGAILRDVNYRGYVVLEYEEDGDPRLECGRQLDALRTAFGV